MVRRINGGPRHILKVLATPRRGAGQPGLNTAIYESRGELWLQAPGLRPIDLGLRTAFFTKPLPLYRRDQTSR
ncbi:hypothetical protein J6590_015114, partial [Homalodisca vitripennis]